jgi:DNA invertase Pin-like site-specific DNA recombinase
MSENSPAAPPRVALYLRVSTAEQTHEPQRRELLEYCARKGWREPMEFSDTISGAKFTRTGLDRLMRAVRKKSFDVTLCVKLDRMGRSLSHLAQLISEFDKHATALICTSQSIDTSHDNPAGRLQMHVLMAVAEFERSLIRERTIAGMIAARARGAKIGRPKVANETGERVRTMLLQIPRPTLRTVAKELRVSLGTVSRLARGSVLCPE